MAISFLWQAWSLDILFVAGFGSIVRDPAAGRASYRDKLGLPLAVVEGDHIAIDGFEGSKHLGIWPLADRCRRVVLRNPRVARRHSRTPGQVLQRELPRQEG